MTKREFVHKLYALPADNVKDELNLMLMNWGAKGWTLEHMTESHSVTSSYDHVHQTFMTHYSFVWAKDE